MQKSGVKSAPWDVLHGLAVGTLCGLVAIVQSAGVGSLLGAGSVSFSLVTVGMTLFSTAVMAIVIPLLGSTPGAIATAQSVPAVALASVVGPLIAAMSGAPERIVIATAVVTVALATVAIGASALLLGALRLGRFIRFVPFPVVGGFLAGSGFLILRGGLDVIAGQPLFADPGSVLEGTVPLRVGSAALFLALLAALTVLSRNRLVLPATVSGALLVFNVAVWGAGVPTEALRADGWLLMLPADGLWPPIAPAEIGLADWPKILASALTIPSVAILTVMAFLMNATGIELDARRDINLNGELASVGAANLLAGAGGGVPGFHSLSLTLLASRLGGTGGNLVGLTVAAACIAALVFGDAVLSTMPTPLLGAMLVWVGGGLIVEWLVSAYSRLPVWEYLVIILIFFVIALFGFAWGILVGLIAAVLLFAVEYGRVDIVRLLVTGKDYHASVDTSEERRQSLLLHGDAILIIRLQGFLFFGTAERLRQRVEEHVGTSDGPPTRFVVIDFRRVTGLDSSTVLSFIRLSQTATRERFTVVFTGVSDGTRIAMLRGGLEVGEDAPIRFVPDFDAGVKWCEDALLSHHAPELAGPRPRPLASRLADILDNADFAAAVANYCERVEVADGEALIEQGTPSDDIFFVESGHAAVAIISDRSAPIRLATIGPGAIVGEIAFYLGEQRSASVIAEEAMVVWRFSRESIRRLQTEMPHVALRFHQGIAAMLAKRLTQTNRLVRLLAD